MSPGELIVVGLSHHTTPVEVRERLAVPADELPTTLRRLMERGSLEEGLLVSTCNRIELYATARGAEAAVAAARAHLGERLQGDPVDRYVYEHRGTAAVEHAFRVASSLDSMVVGEAQILGQVKDAFGVAERAGTLGAVLGRCFRHAFSAAKRVRTETKIASGAVSVSSVAVELTKKIFGELTGRRVLLVGAGKMGETAAASLAKHGATLVVVNRSPERASELARACGGTSQPYEQLAAELTAADVVISSTASPTFIITVPVMTGVVKARRRRPLFVVDIAVPRDVDPRVGDMENVFVYDVDDLQQVASENLKARALEAAAAEEIVREEVARFEEWRRSLELTPTIVSLRNQFHELARAELARTLPKLHDLSDADRTRVEQLCGAIVNKLLHRPLTQLKREAGGAHGPELIDAARRLFDLDGTLPTREHGGSDRPSAPPQERASLSGADRATGAAPGQGPAPGPNPAHAAMDPHGGQRT